MFYYLRNIIYVYIQWQPILENISIVFIKYQYSSFNMYASNLMSLDLRGRQGAWLNCKAIIIYVH